MSLHKPNIITLDNHTIEISDNTTFLGVYLNQILSWSVHINTLSIKRLQEAYGIRVVSKYHKKYEIIFWRQQAKSTVL